MGHDEKKAYLKEIRLCQPPIFRTLLSRKN